MKKKMFLIVLTLVFSVLTATALISGTVGAKSVYAITDINAYSNIPIEAYDIQSAPNYLVYQTTNYIPDRDGGAVGLAIDSDSGYLFATFEFSNVTDLIDGTTMNVIGQVTAPGAVNLAGIVVDHDKSLVYTVDRYTDNFYVYDWVSSPPTLTLKSGFPIDLPNATGLYGIALDETNDILYVADGDSDSYAGRVRYYDTATFTEQGSFQVSHCPIGIAVDVSQRAVYTVAGFAHSDLLSKYDLATSTEQTVNMGHGGMGVAVDPTSNLVYVTGGYFGDDLSVWDASATPFTQLYTTGNLGGDPTGLCIPGKDVSYNPLNLSKNDGLSEEDCVNPEDHVTYEICFDNELNPYDVLNVNINDTLPAEVDFIDASDSGIYDSGTHTVTWDVGTLVSGQAEQCYTLEVEVKTGTLSGTTVTNYVTIKSDETPPTTQSEETLICEETGDTTPPLQTVEFGEPKISTEWYGVVYNVVSCSTPIWINSTDPGGVGSSHITYSMWRADDPYPKPNGQITFIKLYEKTVYDGDPEDIDLDCGEITVLEFTQQSCIHEILYECWDYACNTDGQRDADFIADCCGPETLKEIGHPQYGGDYPNWVSDETSLWFNSTDKCCLPNGTAVSYIVVEVWWKSNFSDPQEPYKHNKTITVYDGDPKDDNPEDGRISYEFHFDDSCCHELRWYGVDIFGNVENMNKQKHKVDVDPPEIIKTVGDPNCEIVAEKEYCITPDTPITFYAEDRGCMGGVGLDTVEYNIWYKGDWTGWISLDELQGGPLYLTEECMHYLLIRATDILGNEIVDNETFYVDDTTPTIEKIVGFPNCYITEDEYCVRTNTIITINASDLGCCDSLFVDYRVWNDSSDSGWIPIGQLPFDFSFTEECFHHFDIRAYDCLGHIVYDNETFYVDDSPPIIEKTVGDPKCVIIDGEEYCITTQTPITINAYNDGCCVDTYLYVEYQINDGDWVLLETMPTVIYIEAECDHTLTIRAYDCLGNMAEDVELFHVDDTFPIIEKTVGDPNCEGNCRFLKLPSSVTMVVQHGGTNAYFDVTLSNVLSGYDIANGDYLGWCVDEEHGISNGIEYSVDIWCSYDPNIPWSDDDWDMVNYLINHKNSSASKDDIQDAIWYFVDGENYPADPEAAAMVDDALANGEGFVPTIGEWCAVLCDEGENIQKTFIEILVPDRYCVTTNTEIIIDAYDFGCCDDITVWYRINGGVWNDITTQLPYSHYFAEECEHLLEIWAFDCLGHETWDNETFYVDDSPPIIEKTVGDPKCVIIEGEEYCITTQTPITINAYNDGCCVDTYLYVEYQINDGDWVLLETLPTVIYIEAECDHTLTIRAYDCLGNMAEDVELFHVDDTFPIIEKTVGDPNCTGCGDMGDGDYCVTTNTEIIIDAYDFGCCDDLTVWYRINGGAWNDITTQLPYSHYFAEECEHLLEIWAFDCLGHETWDIETFYVDDSPPEIIKTVGDPNCTGCGDMGDGDYCVTTDTFITLDAVEQGCCPCLDVTIEYKIGDGNWIEYIEPFNFTEECEHQLYVRAYDCLGNGLDCGCWDIETFYVDDSPPEIIKTVGDPNCTGCGDMGDGDYCVTTDTFITLDAVEQGCCPCLDVTIEYKIGDGNWIEYIEPFNFTEECEHQLYVRAYDCLGNGLDCGCWDIETFYVDETPPPKPEKIVGQPSWYLGPGMEPPHNDQWIICPETEISFTSYGDKGCCPCEEVTVEYRIWYLGSWTDWTEYTGNITLSGGCVHYLEARAYDCLGNRGETDNETFWVCSSGGDSGPEICIIEPTFGSAHCERTLEVKIEASDDETPSSELEIRLGVSGGYNSPPTLWYEPVYNESDGYFYAYIDIFKYQDGTGIELKAVAIDEDHNYERALDVPFTVCSTTVRDQWMQNGWNSLTIPFGGISCNNSVESVLASIDGMYSKVYYYDILEDKWHSWIEELVAEGFVDLENMYCGREYWVKMNGTQARFYTDTHGPEVEILDLVNGEIRSEGPDDINLYAYDVETGIADVHVLISDYIDGSYWDGGVWQEDPVWLLCDYDYGDYWSYPSEGIWTIGHTYNISAIATDGAGCTAVDELWFTVEEEPECEIYAEVTYPYYEPIVGDELLTINGTAYNNCNCIELENVSLALYYTPYNDSTSYPTYYWNGSDWEPGTILYNPVTLVSGGCPEYELNWSFAVDTNFNREGAFTYYIHVAACPEDENTGTVSSSFTVGVE